LSQTNHCGTLGEADLMTGMQVQVEVLYSGRVQGVGFRFNAQHIARNCGVAGFVQNLPDRRVRLVAEGEREEVQRYLERVAASMESNIADADRQEHPYSGAFSGFEIRS
jgi:acylphosphatase